MARGRREIRNFRAPKNGPKAIPKPLAAMAAPSTYEWQGYTPKRGAERMEARRLALQDELHAATEAGNNGA